MSTPNPLISEPIGHSGDGYYCERNESIISSLSQSHPYSNSLSMRDHAAMRASSATGSTAQASMVSSSSSGLLVQEGTHTPFARVPIIDNSPSYCNVNTDTTNTDINAISYGRQVSNDATPPVPPTPTTLNFASPQLGLAMRDNAALRRHEHERAQNPSQQHLQYQQRQYAYPTSNTPQEQRFPYRPHHQHDIFDTSHDAVENVFSPSPGSGQTTPSSASSRYTDATSQNFAQSARKEWRRHGAGMTQVLEETRRQDDDLPGSIMVRIVNAESRKDVAGANYTAYMLQVQIKQPARPSNSSLPIERRYSDFSKLNDMLKKYHVQLDDPIAFFPSKHWAGRLGHWTPALRFAPERHADLVEYRRNQLDVWLVHVVQKYNRHQLPEDVSHAVYEFCTVPHRPPCDQENIKAMLNQRAANPFDAGIPGHIERPAQKSWWNNPISFTLGSAIRAATSTVQYMCHGTTTLTESDRSIPLDLLQHACGLCFLTVIKAGLMVSGRVGTGLLVARVSENGRYDNGDSSKQHWSAPVALGTFGLGWGLLAGGDITHYLVVLTTPAAVESLVNGTVQLGAELGVAVGPVGRGATSQVAAGSGDTVSSRKSSWAIHPAYSYAHSQGLFAGMSVEGSVVSARHDVNANFYGRRGIQPDEILDLPPPTAARPLYDALATALSTPVSRGSVRPSRLWTNEQPTSTHSSPPVTEYQSFPQS